uniref:TMV resistance protein N-like n=1 Tax=Fragaria vesca subsp. vesca TaxID=101020 RepID=UPI0005C9F4C5|nr:PREDICTED: TMV resistance protein N-like [Fragaria vesca subsp. vesca]
MASSSSSSSSEKRWRYDVFLSFRGKDTRKTFTDHLYKALNHAGVNAFIDDNELKRGEKITEELVQAIRGSRISVIVFSDNYGDSSWCLEELVQIMECKKTLGQLVFPIFYHVNPFDVRYQTGMFGPAFEKHEARYGTSTGKVSRWRAALRGAANLSGFDIAGRWEGHFIGNIIDEISSRLNNIYLHVADYPVGIDSRVEDISTCLSVGSDDVRMVGIWGMGGIGKTSLAKAIYNKFFHSFESKSFLANVRETAKDSNGLITLQERLLSDILKPTKIEIGSVPRGINVIKERLGFRKVLVIVDDVDHVEQLTALAIRHYSFGPGSRIIITTRDRHLLERILVDRIYLTREMNDEEAFELFNWHAFQNHVPDAGFLKLSKSVVTYCGGLPLALEVLGSFLFKGSKRDWESTLAKLKKIPDDQIQCKLRISFDAIDENQKEIFLHISCFLIGMDRNYVTQILHGCGYFPETGIRVLLQRCLLTVSEKNKIMMHDLLREMGREVVRAESPKRPEKRSRLWRQEDVIDVLTEESGTEEIEGLALNLQRTDKKSFSSKAITNMRRLNLLKLNYVQVTGDYSNLSKKLIWLCWRGFSPKFIGKEFLNQRNLVFMDLRYSNLIKFWEHSRLLEKLKILNLSHSHYLLESPDFSKLPNLEYLILKDCDSLSEIHQSIGHLKRLALLNVKNCKLLRDLPSSFYNLKSIKTLVLFGCSRFQNLGEDIGKMISLTTLLVHGTAMSQVPSSVGRLQNLNYPSMQGLIRVKLRFPEVPKNYFPALPQGFTSLIYLNLAGSSSGPSLPKLSGLSNLEHLRFNIMANLPASRDLPTNLKELEVDNCTALEVIPDVSKTSRDGLQVEMVAFFSLIFQSGLRMSGRNICPSGISIFVTNYTKLINFAVGPAPLSEITSDEVVWQVNLSNNEFNLEGGDFVEVEAIIGTGFTVKNTGVGLVWDPEHRNENKECEPIRYECESSLGPASSFHHDECESSLGPYSSDEDRFSERVRQEQQPSSLQIRQLKSGSSSQAKPKLKRRHPCSCWW